MKQYKSYGQFENAFITGKITVKHPDGRIGLYSNTPDILYWRPILQNIWKKLAWWIAS